jgi:hypothetical protein
MAHTVTQPTGRGRSRRITYREVPGAGVKYIGYGVQIFEGGEVVGERFSSDRLEQEAAAREP